MPVTFTTTLDGPSGIGTTVQTQNYDEVVDLSWVNNYDTSRPSTRILRSLSSGSSASDYNTVTTVSNGVGSYTDTGVAEDDTYYYRVEATTDDANALSAGEASAYTDLVGWIGETDGSAVRKSTNTGVSRTDEGT
jgi:hypothetical protein